MEDIIPRSFSEITFQTNKLGIFTMAAGEVF